MFSCRLSLQLSKFCAFLWCFVKYNENSSVMRGTKSWISEKCALSSLKGASFCWYVYLIGCQFFPKCFPEHCGAPWLSHKQPHHLAPVVWTCLWKIMIYLLSITQKTIWNGNVIAQQWINWINLICVCGCSCPYTRYAFLCSRVMRLWYNNGELWIISDSAVRLRRLSIKADTE